MISQVFFRMSKLSPLSTTSSESTDSNQTSTAFQTSRHENESDECEVPRSSLEWDRGSSAPTPSDEGTDKLHPLMSRTGKEIQVEYWDKISGSPAASYESMTSDRSMEIPPRFSHEKYVPGDPYTRQMMREHLRCTECKDVLKEPMSIPCGHSFCKSCIQSHWTKPAQIGNYSCPQCMERFTTRPALNLNVTLANVVQTHQRSRFSPAVHAQSYAGPGDVACDICTRSKIRAVKTCRTCSVSYCDAHVRTHYTVEALQKHVLLEPTKDLEQGGVNTLGKANTSAEVTFANDLINNLVNQVKQLQNQVTSMEVKLERRKTEDEPPRKCLRTQLEEAPEVSEHMPEGLDFAVPNYPVPKETFWPL